MRLVQVRVPNDQRSSVLDVLDDMDAEYTVVEEATGDVSLIQVPLTTGAVEEVLTQLHDAGLDDDAFTLISPLESATTPQFDELEGQFVQGPTGEVSLSVPELQTTAEELTPKLPMLVVFSAISSIVATVGLLLNSAIIIVGAMVISPFPGPILSAVLGIINGDRTLVASNLKAQAIGLLVALVSAVIVGAVFRWGHFAPPEITTLSIGQLRNFSTPSIFVLIVAIFAGAAGALALTTDLPVAVAGVAVAAAIIPAGAAAGIGIVWTQPLLAIGAATLLFVNVVFINCTAFLGLWLFGYRSVLDQNLLEMLSFSLRGLAYAVVFLVLIGVFAVALYSTYQYVSFQRTVSQNIEDVLNEPPYESLDLAGVQVEFGAGPFLTDRQVVTVTVTKTAGKRYPQLAAVLQRQIARQTDRTVIIQLRFLARQRAGPQRRVNRTTNRLINPLVIAGPESRPSGA